MCWELPLNVWVPGSGWVKAGFMTEVTGGWGTEAAADENTGVSSDSKRCSCLHKGPGSALGAGIDMKQGPRGALMVDEPAAEERDREMTSLGC